MGANKPKRNGEHDDNDPSPPLPPDGGWGWIVVLASFTSNMIVDGVCFSFGMFYQRFMDHYGESASKTMWAGSLLTGGYFLMGPIASALMNRYGCRRVTIAGSIIAAVGFFASAFAPNLNMLILFYGVIGGLGFGLIYLPSVVIVGYYFEKKRAFATGIALCGSGVGTLVFAPLTDKLLSHYGLAGALLIVSAVILKCAVCGALFRPLENYEAYRQSYRKERDIPKHKIHRGSIFTKIMEDKERQRTISQGSLDGCIITRENQLIKASNNTMNRLLQQETLATLTMKRYINQNASLGDSCVKLPSVNGNGKLNGQAGLAFATRRGTEPILCGANGLIAASGAANVYEPGATGSLPMTRSLCSSFSNNSSAADGSNNVVEPWADDSSQSVNAARNEAVESLRRDLARPMYRKDILYNGSMHHVTQFEASPTVRTYIKSTTSVPDEKATCWDHCPYSEPVTNVFREMLDPCLFKSYTFVLLSISSIATMLALFVPYVFIVQMVAKINRFEPDYNLEAQSASYLISIIGLCNVFGRIMVGLVADRPWANALCINNIALIVAGIATMLSPLCVTYGHLVLYASVFGLSIAAFAALRSIVVVELLGLERLTNAYGLLLLFQGVANIVGSPVAALFGDKESYDTAFYLSGALILFSGLICLPLRCVSNWERRKNGEASTYAKACGSGQKEYTEVESIMTSV